MELPKDHMTPEPIKAGDRRVLLNGRPPRVDCRVIAEEEYQLLRKAYLDNGGQLSR